MLNVNPTVPWYYPLIILSAPAAAVGLACRDRNASSLTPRQRLGLSLGAFCGAMIGGKPPFALADWHGLLGGRVWFESGKTIVFALVGGYFGVEIMKRRLGVVVKTGDGFAGRSRRRWVSAVGDASPQAVVTALRHRCLGASTSATGFVSIRRKCTSAHFTTPRPVSSPR